MARTLIEILIEEGFTPRHSGNRFVLNCPFHKGDREPSFTIYPTDTYWCWGCKVWGDSVKFLVDYKGMSAQEALEYVGLDYKQPRAEKSKVIKITNTVETWTFLYRVATSYHDYLGQLRGARNYLLGRGLNEETINKYKVGYTDGKVLNLTFAHERQLADEIGIMTRKGFETMSHRITVPNLLDGERADFLIGRTIINDGIKYLGARMPKPLIGFHEIRHSPIIFLVEGQFDWLTLRQWGYPAICVSGSYLKPYMRLPLMGKEVIIIPDIDDDGIGMQEAKRTVEQFGEKGTLLDITPLKQGVGKLDVNSLMQTPDGEERFRQLVKERLPWITSLSKDQLTKWFPNLITTKSFLSTLKLQD